jgi:two-component system sensor histidine kinase KdpD
MAGEGFASRKKEGVLKILLGYAPGLGKTYTMLSEANRRRRRGQDVVVGFVETHGRKPIQDLLSTLEQIPKRRLTYKGIVFEEMDVDAIHARRPGVVLVDELAHTNIEGSKHAKRYEDVMELLAAKIDVLSTMNIQRL